MKNRAKEPQYFPISADECSEKTPNNVEMLRA
jgi:hypothetical protein